MSLRVPVSGSLLLMRWLHGVRVGKFRLSHQSPRHCTSPGHTENPGQHQPSLSMTLSLLNSRTFSFLVCPSIPPPPPPLSYRRHIHNIAVRANQRLGQLKKASPFLDCSSRDRVYKAFLRPIMEYCPPAWMGAAETHLQQLNRVQRRALHIIGAGTWLPHRRLVVVVYLYLTSAKCTGIPAFSLWPEATALTEMVKVELHERKKMKFYNV